MAGCITIGGLVGPQAASDGTKPSIRQGNSAEIIAQELHGHYYEQAKRGNVYTYGVSNTALNTNNAIDTGTGSSSKPVLGVWNPPSSPVDLVILKAILVCTTVANTAVSPGGFMWLTSFGQTTLSTGSLPWNVKTFQQSGSQAKAFSIATTLTGLSGVLTVLRAVGVGGINAAGPATAITQPIAPVIEEVEGGLIVVPGNLLVIMNQTSTTTVSYSTGLIWEEVLS